MSSFTFNRKLAGLHPSDELMDAVNSKSLTWVAQQACQSNPSSYAPSIISS